MFLAFSPLSQSFALPEVHCGRAYGRHQVCGTPGTGIHFSRPAILSRWALLEQVSFRGGLGGPQPAGSHSDTAAHTGPRSGCQDSRARLQTAGTRPPSRASESPVSRSTSEARTSESRTSESTSESRTSESWASGCPSAGACRHPGLRLGPNEGRRRRPPATGEFSRTARRKPTQIGDSDRQPGRRLGQTTRISDSERRLG